MLHILDALESIITTAEGNKFCQTENNFVGENL